MLGLTNLMYDEPNPCSQHSIDTDRLPRRRSPNTVATSIQYHRQYIRQYHRDLVQLYSCCGSYGPKVASLQLVHLERTLFSSRRRMPTSLLLVHFATASALYASKSIIPPASFDARETPLWAVHACQTEERGIWHM